MTASRLALPVLSALAVLLTVALVPLSILARQPGYATQPVIIALPCAAVGIVVAGRRHRNPIGWLMLAVAGALLASTDAGLYALVVYRIGRSLPLGPVGLLLYLLWSPALALLMLVILLFPDGQLPSRRWRWPARVYCLLCGGYVVALTVATADAFAARRIRVDSFGGLNVVDYPVGWFAVAQDVIFGAVVTLGVCFAGRQVASWRRSPGDRRQQLGWLMSGAAVCLLCAGLSILPVGPSGLWRALSDALALGFAALPVSIGIGILKYRLYDIDRLISRTLSYAIVTGLLIGVYALLVTLTHSVLSIKSPIAVAASTLGAVALFSPVRRRVQRVVDRHFYREHYDAERTVAAFADRLKDAVDLDEVLADLTGIVQEALEPAHVCVWVAEVKR